VTSKATFFSIKEGYHFALSSRFTEPISTDLASTQSCGARGGIADDASKKPKRTLTLERVELTNQLTTSTND
jgi:hypothetical protein